MRNETWWGIALWLVWLNGALAITAIGFFGLTSSGRAHGEAFFRHEAACLAVLLALLLIGRRLSRKAPEMAAYLRKEFRKEFFGI